MIVEGLLQNKTFRLNKKPTGVLEEYELFSLISLYTIVFQLKPNLT